MDYVIIDKEPNLAELSYMKPDYFVKGREYIVKINPKTLDEINTIKNMAVILFIPLVILLCPLQK